MGTLLKHGIWWKACLLHEWKYSLSIIEMYVDAIYDTEITMVQYEYGNHSDGPS